jgi:RNA-splicing ligase RtcB
MKVKAMKDVMDNGKRYKSGEVFEMEDSLVDVHVKVGQVAIADAAKEVVSPADKQQAPGKTK